MCATPPGQGRPLGNGPNSSHRLTRGSLQTCECADCSCGSPPVDIRGVLHDNVRLCFPGGVARRSLRKRPLFQSQLLSIRRLSCLVQGADVTHARTVPPAGDASGFSQQLYLVAPHPVCALCNSCRLAAITDEIFWRLLYPIDPFSHQRITRAVPDVVATLTSNIP